MRFLNPFKGGSHLETATWKTIMHPEKSSRNAWTSFWEELPARQDLYRVQSREYVRNLLGVVPMTPDSRILDFGCGFGYVAEQLSPRVAEVFVWDSSDNMCRQAMSRLTRLDNVAYLDLSAPSRSPGNPRLDFILVNSVIQYMTPDDFSMWLANWSQMLTPAGRIVISDVIPPGYNLRTDLLSLLSFSARRGMLFRAVFQASRDILHYARARQTQPLTCFSRDDLACHGEVAGLSVQFLPRNLTHFGNRITAVYSAVSITAMQGNFT